MALKVFSVLSFLMIFGSGENPATLLFYTMLQVIVACLKISNLNSKK
jgi:hypothetical protein